VIFLFQKMQKTITVNNHKTTFFRFGHGEKKLVILHGWDQHIDVFASYKELIHDLFLNNKFAQNYEIIMPNLPGFGESDMPPETGFNTNEYADWLLGFLKALNIHHATFLSHSFGGRVLVRFLLKNPNFSDRVILMSSAGIKWPLSRRQRFSIFLSKNLTRAKNLFPQKLQKFVISNVFGARDWGAVRHELKPTLNKVLKEPDFRHELSKIHTPALLIWGEEDSVTPLKSGHIFAKKLPNNQLITVTNGAHGIHRTHSEEVADYVLQFLECK